MSARNEDFLFAQEAQNLGYVTEAQVEEGFLLQQRMADDLQIDERLAVILVKRGWLADEQARRVYGIIEPEGARSQIEGYRLLEKIGRGAMGTVYRALHKGLNRTVAIKILRRDLAADKTQIERLKREAKLLADLEHPNVVRAFDAGESNGFPYLVMEYVPGETLRDRIAREGPLPEDEALRITRDLADALEKARRMGVVHRDVKPGNILIAKDGTPKLMDLGLAKGPIDAGLTQHGATVGTPQFMSPEQAESPNKADTRSDIYSLGATLYAMVTGRPPFEGTTLAEIITKVMSQQPVPPGMRNREVSSEVSHLIERMMLKDASLRYATPALVMLDIDRIRGGQSIIPRGFQGNWEAYLLRKRFLEWRKRIVAGVAALLVLGVGVFLYLDHTKKETARREMERKADALLEIPDVQPDDDRASLESRLAQLREGDGELERLSDRAHVPYTRRDLISNRIKELEQARDLLRKCEVLDKKELAPLREAGQWAAALVRARDHRTEMARTAPSNACWQRLVADLREASRSRLQQARDGVAALPVVDVESFVARHRAREALYAYPWIEEGDFARRRAAAQTAREKADAIGALLVAFRERFAPAALAARVEALEFYELRRDFGTASERLRSEVRGHVASWPRLPEGERERVQGVLFGEQGLVSGAVGEIDERIDARVRAAWIGLKQALADLEPRDALARLERFANMAERGNHYNDLAEEARVAERDLRAAVRARLDAEREVFDQLRRQVLAELRRGDPVRIREVAAAVLAGEDLRAARREDVGALLEAAAALERLHEGAFSGLETMLAGGGPAVLRDVVYRDDTGTRRTARQWVLRGLDRERGVLSVRMPRGDKKGTLEIRVAQVALPTLRAWLALSDVSLSPLHGALLDAAALPPPEDRPGTDLRPLVRDYRALQDRFGEAPPGPQWRRLMGELVLRLEGGQREREDEAQRTVSYIKQVAFFDEKWKGLVELVDKLLDPAGRLRFTRAVENVIEDLQDKRRWALDALDKDELRRMFAGDVKPTEREGGATELLFDFDDVKQLENFEHGFAEWRRGDAIVKSGDEDGGRLHVLPGVRGFVRDRPLVLRSMFDPARPISVEMRVHFLRGSSMLAFDLDGLQIAICSFDPNLWKRRFRDGAPRLQDEEELPEFDFYGMGRGVAFHQGLHFGRSFPHGNWDWRVEGQGRNFVRLRDRNVIQDAEGRLFAFDPGAAAVRVRVERERNFMRLFVNDKLVIEEENHAWTTYGATSEIDRKVRNGTGRLQILTWTPMVVDDLRLRGTIREGWKAERRKAMAAAASKEAGR